MVRRTLHRLLHDPSRVIAKPYLPGEEISADSSHRADLLMARILAVPEEEVSAICKIRSCASAPGTAGSRTSSNATSAWSRIG